MNWITKSQFKASVSVWLLILSLGTEKKSLNYLNCAKFPFKLLVVCSSGKAIRTPVQRNQLQFLCFASNQLLINTWPTMWERKSMRLTGKQWTSRIIVTKNNSQTALTEILVSWRIWDKSWTCNRHFSGFNKDFRRFKLIATWNLTQTTFYQRFLLERKEILKWSMKYFFCEYSQRTQWCVISKVVMDVSSYVLKPLLFSIIQHITLWKLPSRKYNNPSGHVQCKVSLVVFYFLFYYF